MALRQDEAVATGSARGRNLQYFAIEHGQDVGDAHRRPDVADVRPLRLLEHDATYVRWIDGHRHSWAHGRGSIAIGTPIV